MYLMDIFTGFIVGMLAFLAIAIIVSLVLHVFHAIGVYKLSKANGISFAGLAFAPGIAVINVYELAREKFRIKVGEYVITNPYYIVAGIIVSRYLPLVSNLSSLALYVLTMYMYYLLYKIYKPEKATMYGIIGFVLPITIPILVYTIRNEDRKD